MPNVQEYYNLTDYQANLFNQWAGPQTVFAKQGVKTTTCLLTCKNGFEIVGTSACVNPTDFNEQIGREYALKDALRQLDALVGFWRQQVGYDQHDRAPRREDERDSWV